MTKQEQLDKLMNSGIVAVVRRPPSDKVQLITDALVAGGVEALEITVDSEGVFELIPLLKEKYGGQVLVGAGTVMNASVAEKALQAGADFIFSPILDEATIKITNRYGRISIPGVMTPTEIAKGYEWGADVLKIFPGATLGASYIKEVSAPLAGIPMMPTGGVTLDNVAEFIHAGAVAVGLGSSLLNKAAIAEERYDDITELARRFKAAITRARG
ncbi:bifunctional 4-hydroxy-2-oxoglutarate aldolase/2-dehydro-3-deoxy-phosphogluconate aldolase [Paenibacillus apis]|uniref:Bifunctional 2-keto-4-hydroxyglutarate aldolase/2-keto-3-deoxy-6-phosphogluconate aldolase n=1 Tax=Paenibacillus apis TaxID=1792174 RepID=A0A920CK10_9BACL|nr:bifunctional 4-hydroxy-2-oxoglutarate aldolase/2-dehydro-3-deoxy-phosphogluconate aldolase [Paenibacillus apis]GIO43376.1 bifunctional 2-keto-4-hydroxyglutarate aldolase/2-keto-3-deoxy-6-phosphogluconate aldolase [Paenibacillus apis]